MICSIITNIKFNLTQPQLKHIAKLWKKKSSARHGNNGREETQPNFLHVVFFYYLRYKNVYKLKLFYTLIISQKKMGELLLDSNWLREALQKKSGLLMDFFRKGG